MDFLVKLFQTLGLAFHKLFHYHCEHCRMMDEEAYERIEDAKVCHMCEFLKVALEQEKLEKKRLLDSIIAPAERQETSIDPEAMKPFGRRFTPFSVMRQQLEKKYRVQPEKEKTTEELEDELGINEDADELNQSNS